MNHNMMCVVNCASSATNCAPRNMRQVTELVSSSLSDSVGCFDLFTSRAPPNTGICAASHSDTFLESRISSSPASLDTGTAIGITGATKITFHVSSVNQSRVQDHCSVFSDHRNFASIRQLDERTVSLNTKHDQNSCARQHVNRKNGSHKSCNFVMHL